MLTTTFVCSTILIFTSFYGLLIRRDNLIISMICLEMALLGVALLFAASAILLDDINGTVMFFVLLTLAGVESSIGLALVINYYRLRTSIR